MINKETMNNPIEIKKSSDVKIHISDKGTNTGPIDIKSQMMFIMKSYQPINHQKYQNTKVPKKDTRYKDFLSSSQL
jgi:hypothetical protein